MCCVLHVSATYHAGLYNVFFHGLVCLFIGLGKTKMRTTCGQNADNMRTKYGQKIRNPCMTSFKGARAF
jgi:hypothetical protein